MKARLVDKKKPVRTPSPVCKKHISGSAVSVWRIRMTCLLIVFSFLMGGAFVFIPLTTVMISAAGIIVYLFYIFFYFPLYYRNCYYSFGEERITVVKGWLVRSHTEIKLSSVHYCIISTGPIQKLFGVCTIRFMMAGTHCAIGEISVRDANRLKKYADNPENR